MSARRTISRDPAAASGPLPDAGRADGQEVDAALAALAEDARSRVDELTALVTSAIVGAEPQLGADDAIAGDLWRSARANVERGLGLIVGPDGAPAPGDAPPEAAVLATSLLRRGVEPGALIQAYRVGQNAFWGRWMRAAAAQIDDPAVLVAVLERSSARMFGYVDAVIAHVLRHYQEERERWLGGTLARRAEVLHAVLAGEDGDAQAASRALGFDLERPLVALALWRVDNPPASDLPLDGLERLAREIAAALGDGRALTLPAGSATLWAWIAAAQADALELTSAAAEASRGPQEAVALAGPWPGPAGMRRAHREALEARRVAQFAGSPGIVRHDEVELVALLSADPERLQGFVTRALGPLVADDAATERLRESLTAWFASGGNARSAAEVLGTHKNTVLYRVHRAEALLDRPLSTGALDVQVALEALRRLGPRVCD